MKCFYCGVDKPKFELRPYGPSGSWVCLPCVMESPERNAAAGAAFRALLEAASAISPTGVVLIDDGEGPRPFDLGELG